MSDRAFDPLFDLLEPDALVYVPGASAESAGLIRELECRPDRAGVHFVSCLLPGINSFDYSMLHPRARVTTFLLPQALRNSFEQGRVEVCAFSYTQIAAAIVHWPLDVAVAHVAPPNAEGDSSLGIAADFTPIAWRCARRRAVIVNHSMPRMRRGPTIPISEADVVVEVDEPPAAMGPSSVSRTPKALAERVVALVSEGATIQVGIGGALSAIWTHLAEHRNLVIHSGIVTEGILVLADRGALARSGPHRTGIAFGSLELYGSLADRDMIAFGTVPETHGSAVLSGLQRFTAINSAFEVDLFGQVNLEWQAGRLISGVGGAPEFARAASRSIGGRSIVALPATARGGTVSRIVPRLNVPTVSIPRYDVDDVVTEWGVARLRGLSFDQRATRLLDVADPKHRERLAAAWSDIRRAL